MKRLSTWSRVSFALSIIFFIIGFIAPILNEKLIYSGKIVEAESVVKNIADDESEYYATNNKYISIPRYRENLLIKNFNRIRKDDLKYYNYTISTTMNSFKILAEPKVKFLKTREVAPQIYTYEHILQGKSLGYWSNF